MDTRHINPNRLHTLHKNLLRERASSMNLSPGKILGWPGPLQACLKQPSQFFKTILGRDSQLTFKWFYAWKRDLTTQKMTPNTIYSLDESLRWLSSCQWSSEPTWKFLLSDISHLFEKQMHGNLNELPKNYCKCQTLFQL